LRALDSVIRVNSETAARLGGDEFIILLDGLRSENDAVLVSERIQSIINEPIRIADQDLIITVSIGDDGIP
jgi:GGDEF domain-containing protein